MMFGHAGKKQLMNFALIVIVFYLPCETILKTLKGMNFAEIQEQGFMPLYKREKITDDLHEACGFRTDYQFITKSQMKTIQKKSKERE